VYVGNIIDYQVDVMPFSCALTTATTNLSAGVLQLVGCASRSQWPRRMGEKAQGLQQHCMTQLMILGSTILSSTTRFSVEQKKGINGLPCHLAAISVALSNT